MFLQPKLWLKIDSTCIESLSLPFSIKLEKSFSPHRCSEVIIKVVEKPHQMNNIDDFRYIVL